MYLNALYFIYTKKPLVGLFLDFSFDVGQATCPKIILNFQSTLYD